MEHWELWHHPDGIVTYFRSDKEELREKAEEAGGAVIWETDVLDFTEAMRAWSEFDGVELDEPMLREDGTPLPEDEADELRKRMKNGHNARFCLRCPITDHPVHVSTSRRGLDWGCPLCIEFHPFHYRKTQVN